MIEVAKDGRTIKAFHEKPLEPIGIPDAPDQVLASMGNYVFDTEALIDVVTADAQDESSSHDIGRDIIPRLVRGCDLLVGNPGAAAAMLGVPTGDGDPHDPAFVRSAAERIAAEHGCRAIAITLRDVVSASEHRWGAALWDGTEHHAVPQRSFRVVDRVGGGDSFAAALIFAPRGASDPASTPSTARLSPDI